MFEKITPEQAGVSSKNVTKFIKNLQKRGAITHDFCAVVAKTHKIPIEK